MWKQSDLVAAWDLTIGRARGHVFVGLHSGKPKWWVTTSTTNPLEANEAGSVDEALALATAAMIVEVRKEIGDLEAALKKLEARR